MHAQVTKDGQEEREVCRSYSVIHELESVFIIIIIIIIIISSS